MIMDAKATVLAILEDLTGEDVSGDMNVNLFDTALMDSMDTVQLVLELTNQLDIDIPVSEFDRSQWDTPQKIVDQVEAKLQ
ncbi:D-alanine--poly(phosphoribitol) ligase subunit DltC [Lacticaseibacillus pantheris]|nr:D-alanine--poly(phosphoribitol) ligase subunit DltC [Lacticaseibacillus pantheris]WKF86208.1 D-alanine--poly(phosphoribitol) ligase subunit DltC [Lacticaseibacillus pantheris]